MHMQVQNRSYELPSKTAMTAYFVSVSKHASCFKQGIDEAASIKQRMCVCNDDFRGEDCGVPIGVWNTGDNAKLLHSTLKLCAGWGNTTRLMGPPCKYCTDAGKRRHGKAKQKPQ